MSATTGAGAASSTASLPELECACASIRRAARLVTQLYSDEMGKILEPPQFALLSALHAHPGIVQSALGRALGFDKTTLSRNLSLMKKKRWIEAVGSGDHRERGYRLTTEGASLVAAAKPNWKRAQERLRAALAPGEWEQMLAGFNRIANAVAKARAGGSK